MTKKPSDALAGLEPPQGTWVDEVIRKIVSARIRRYRDTGQVIAFVHWSDGSCTEGPPENEHMFALIARAQREGLAVVRETW